MKKILSTTMVLITFLLSSVAQASETPAPCITLKDNIARKIIRNGVPATDFKLDIVAKDTELNEGKVVGNCGFGSHKIVYIRGKDINPQGFLSEQSGNESPSLDSPTVIEPEESEVKAEPEIPAQAVNEESSVSDEPIAEPKSEAAPETKQQTESQNTVQPDNQLTEPKTNGQPALTVARSSGTTRITNSDNSIIIHR